MRRKGFSILETVLYLGLLAVILTILMTFLVNILRREAKVETVLEVGQNAKFALERITGTIRNSKAATVPEAGLTSSTLSLTMADAALSPTIFAVSNGVLTMKQGTAAAVPLISNDVAVTGLVFRNLLDPVYNLRTEPVVVTCQTNQNKRLICHNGNTQCVNKNAKLAEGDNLGPCYAVTSAKSTIKVEMTIASPPAAGPGNEFQSTVTLYDSATVPRQN